MFLHGLYIVFTCVVLPQHNLSQLAQVSQLRYQQFLEDKILEMVEVNYADALRLGLLDAGLAGSLRLDGQLGSAPGRVQA